MQGKAVYRPLVAVLTLLAMTAALVSGAAGRAAADEDYIRGTTSGTINFGAGDNFGILQMVAGKAGWWVSCDVAGYWTTVPSTNLDYLHIFGGCRRGWAMNDGDLELWTEVDGCGELRARPGNIDDPDETGSFDVLMIPDGGDGSSGEDCGSAGTLCAAIDGEGEVCKAWSVGAPPDDPDPDNAPGPGADTCPRGKPMKPWVTELHPEAVTGGWAWVSEGALRIADQTATTGISATPGAALNGADMFMFAFLRTTGLNFAGGLRITSPRYNGGQAGGTSSSQYLAGSLDWTGSLPAQQGSLTWKVTGATKTTAFGSGVPDWSYSQVGYYPDPGANAMLSPGEAGGDPYVEANYSANNGFDMARNHVPAACYFMWGVAQNGTTAGPITYQPANEPEPPPYVPPITSPPIIHVGPEAECPVGADVCIDPDTNSPEDPTSIPDPEDSSCDFSISDPSTWGGQIICALVAVAKAIIGMIESVLSFLVGLLEALADLLFSLFVPDPSSWGLDGLLDQLNGRAPFSVFGDLAIAMGAVAGAYEGGDSCSGALVWEDVGGTDATIDCAQLSGIPGIAGARTVVSLGLIAVTGWTIFGMLAGMVNKE